MIQPKPETTVLPVIHLNGSGVQRLLDNAGKVSIALRDLRNAMADAAPHGRDYYVVEGLWQQAQAQQDYRRSLLAALEESYELEAAGLVDLSLR